MGPTARWLKTHLNPTTKLEWNIQNYLIPTKLDPEWTDLRITRLDVTFTNDVSFWCQHILPRLRYLTYLKVGTLTDDLNDFFAFLATNNVITELQLRLHNFEWTESSLIDLFRWFRRQLVRRFKCLYNLRQDLYQIMLNCPTLDKLKLSSCYLDDMDYDKLSFAMKTLSLKYDSFNSEHLKSLARRLEMSKVCCLMLLEIPRDYELASIEYLMQFQP
ncbi:hypothetical protein LEN26_014849 [Aphanomyces euteiches]|nr:hypothetical protein LEN26_014849 [Aphanomyces euteiches]